MSRWLLATLEFILKELAIHLLGESSMKEDGEFLNEDFAEHKLTEENIGYKMLPSLLLWHPEYQVARNLQKIANNCFFIISSVASLTIKSRYANISVFIDYENN